IAARVAEACHNSRLHRIGAGGKDNGDSGSRRFRRKGRYRADWRNNNSYLTLDQIGRHFPKPAIFTVRPAKFDRDILALSVAGFGNALSKCREQASAWFRRARMQEADYRHLLLLRSCSQRPRRRAAEQRDELAPPHSNTSSARPTSDNGMLMPRA